MREERNKQPLYISCPEAALSPCIISEFGLIFRGDK